jgi:hypothetical protein
MSAILHAGKDGSGEVMRLTPPAVEGLDDESMLKYVNLVGHEYIRPYTGDVYCITTPTGIFYTRRQGKPMWMYGGKY